jgi:hypothetical protein
MRRVLLIGCEILSAHVYRGGVSAGVGYAQVEFFLGWWPLLFSQEWWGLIRYEVLGSPAVCSSREPVISRFLGRNR